MQVRAQLSSNDSAPDFLPPYVEEQPHAPPTLHRGTVGLAIPLAELWLELLAGSWHVEASDCCEFRCHLFLRRIPKGAARRPVAARDRELLERILAGDTEKAVAIDQGVSTSTVATHLTSVLRGWGLKCGANGVPALLVIALHACRGATSIAYGSMSSEDQLSRVSAPRPDRSLPDLLSSAERHVTRRLVEGWTRTAIARERQRSERTVANQIATIFSKLSVSGRRSLIALLVQGSRELPTA